MKASILLKSILNKSKDMTIFACNQHLKTIFKRDL